MGPPPQARKHIYLNSLIKNRKLSAKLPQLGPFQAQDGGAAQAVGPGVPERLPAAGNWLAGQYFLKSKHQGRPLF